MGRGSGSPVGAITSPTTPDRMHFASHKSSAAGRLTAHQHVIAVIPAFTDPAGIPIDGAVTGARPR